MKARRQVRGTALSGQKLLTHASAAPAELIAQATASAHPRDPRRANPGASSHATTLAVPAATIARVAGDALRGNPRDSRPAAAFARAANVAVPAGIVAGVAADALFGDPRRGHPVAAFGRAATLIENRIYADSVARGAGYTAACVTLAAAPALAAAHLGRGRPWLAFAATAAATWTVTGARSLAREAGRIQAALERGDLPAARAALPSLCGRDPRGLDEKQISRAVIESVAENSGDAVVSPLCWGALAGTTGLIAYRAINTLDAMVGHRSPRLARFGTASARLDDVANWAPARLTALLAAACAPVAGGRPRQAWRLARRYGRHHPSPNAGWCEAAFAGALGVRLGGSNSYDGVAEDRPELGDGRAPEPADIARAVRLSHAVTVTAAATAATLAALLSRRPRT